MGRMLHEWMWTASSQTGLIYGVRKRGKSSTLEIDFIAQTGSVLLPIEVKAEENVKSKSLHSFIHQEYASSHFKGIRFSMLGFKDQEWMMNVPLYAARTYMKYYSKGDNEGRKD